MKIIYHCFGGAHASATAAAIHLGILPMDRTPSKEELLAAPFYDGPDSSTHGTINFVGKDAWNNEIFILGRKTQPELMERLLREMVSLLGEDPNQWHLIDCYQAFNFLMMLGGYSSRALKVPLFGRPIVTRGTLLAYRNICRVVQKAKKEMGLV